jgi:hypothetical protein
MDRFPSMSMAMIAMTLVSALMSSRRSRAGIFDLEDAT